MISSFTLIDSLVLYRSRFGYRAVGHGIRDVNGDYTYVEIY